MQSITIKVGDALTPVTEAELGNVLRQKQIATLLALVDHPMSLEEIHALKGIGPKTVKAIKTIVSKKGTTSLGEFLAAQVDEMVEGDINNQKEEEIMEVQPVQKPQPVIKPRPNLAVQNSPVELAPCLQIVLIARFNLAIPSVVCSNQCSAMKAEMKRIYNPDGNSVFNLGPSTHKYMWRFVFSGDPVVEALQLLPWVRVQWKDNQFRLWIDGDSNGLTARFMYHCFTQLNVHRGMGHGVGQIRFEEGVLCWSEGKRFMLNMLENS